MKALKTTYLVTGFCSLFFLLISMGIWFYGMTYQIPNEDPIVDAFKLILMIGAVLGLTWAFLILTWLILDEYIIKKN